MAKSLIIIRKILPSVILQKMKSVHNHRLKERLQVLLWFQDGYDCTQIAGKIGRCRQIVSGYLTTYDRYGLNKLMTIGRGPGRQSQLSKTDKKKLLRWISISPRKMGYTFNNWDCKRLSIHIKKEFKVAMSSEQVRRILHKLGCRLLRPRHKLLQANPELIAKKNVKFKGLWLSPEKLEELSFSKMK